MFAYASIPLSYWRYWEFNHKVAFDGVKRLIYITSNIFDIDFQRDIYSAWKEWVALDDNSKYTQAIDVVGGEAITPTELISPTFFLINGWKIKPWAGTYDLTITGNVYTDDLTKSTVPADYGNIETTFVVSSVVRTMIHTVVETIQVPVVEIVEVPAVIIPPTVQEITDGVLGATAANYDVPGTIGEKINDIGVTDVQVDYGDVADAVWNARISDYNTGGTFGKRIRNISEDVIWSGPVVSSTINTVTLDPDASPDTGAYDPAEIMIHEGTGIGQCRMVLEYDGPTRTAVVDRNWKTLPDETSVIVVLTNPGREHVNEGLLRGATLSTVTLNTAASDIDNAYTGQIIFIRSGKGEDQARRVGSYNGVTKVATLTRNWGSPYLTEEDNFDNIPDNTSAYVILPTGSLSYQCIREAVYDAPDDKHNTPGTRGAQFTHTNEEAHRARAMATNKVDITRAGAGPSAIDSIVVYDDDGSTILYQIIVTGDKADNRQVTYVKPYSA